MIERRNEHRPGSSFREPDLYDTDEQVERTAQAMENAIRAALQRCGVK